MSHINDSYHTLSDGFITTYVSLNNDTNISSTDTPVLAIDYQLTDIYIVTIVVPFVLSLIINIVLIVSLMQAIHQRDDTSCIRRGQSMPVVDLILLILFMSTIVRLLLKTGLQVLCLKGVCIIGVPLCLFHGFLNSLLYYVNLWSLSLLIQDRYIKHRAQHDYTSKCSTLIVIVTLVGLLFLASVHVCGPIWGFSNYEFINDEITCAVNWKSDYSCSYLIFSVLLISLPASLPLNVWTVMLIYKIVRRQYFPDSARRRKSKESPMISVSLTSSLASSSIAALSKSFVLNESYEILTVMLVSVTFIATSVPKNIVDAVHGCTSTTYSSALVFWTSIVSELGSTLVIPFILLAFNQKLRRSVPTIIHFCLTHCRQIAGDNSRHTHRQQDSIYLSSRPSTSKSMVTINTTTTAAAATPSSSTTAVTVI